MQSGAQAIRPGALASPQRSLRAGEEPFGAALPVGEHAVERLDAGVGGDRRVLARLGLELREVGAVGVVGEAGGGADDHDDEGSQQLRPQGDRAKGHSVFWDT